MSEYLHGLHDAGGEHLMADKPGWVVITESIGSNPSDMTTKDYSELASRGFSVIVRLNNAHNGTDGTYPTQDRYSDFSVRCANFCRGMKGVRVVIIGNEPNHAQERPHQHPITPQMAAECFNLCYAAIKSLPNPIDVLTPAIAPWDNTTIYPGNPTGDWLIYMRNMLGGIDRCDGFAIHAYTHGIERALIRDETINLEWYWHFPVFRQQLSIIAPAMRHLPVYITEANPGDNGWTDLNNGWISEAYAYVDEWNRQPGTQKVVALTLFRWKHYPGQPRWGIQERHQLQEDFKQAVARGYPVGSVYAAKDKPNTNYLPSIEGGSEVAKQLPARSVDERAARKGIEIVPVAATAGHRYWRVARIQTPDVKESERIGPDHHILINALVDGKREYGLPILVQWGGGGKDEQAMIETKPNDGYDWSADFGMSPGDFSVTIFDEYRSESVKGIKMGWWDTEGRWNPGAHTNVMIDFELITAGNGPAPAPTPPDTQPSPKPDPELDEDWFDVPRTGSVVVSSLNIRGGPGTQHAIIGSLKFGEKVVASLQISSQGYDWLNIGDGRWVAGQYVSWGEELVKPSPDADKDWERVWPIILRIEGGLSLDPRDTGNWYNGKLVGTKYGISAAVWGGQYDIPNLTKTQALDIYKEHYWIKAGCDKLAWPMNLIVFDTAVNHGVGVAVALLNKVPTREEAYLGLRALRYFEDPKWKDFGIAWGNRIEHLDDIIDGEIAA